MAPAGRSNSLLSMTGAPQDRLSVSEHTPVTPAGPGSGFAVFLFAHAVDLPLDHGAAVVVDLAVLPEREAPRRPQVERGQDEDDEHDDQHGDPLTAPEAH